MKISARNVFEGTVTANRPGAVNDEIEVTTDAGPKLVAMVTRGSSESLDLQVGHKVIALVKASSVLLATELEGVRLSTRNRLEGTVESVKAGAVNAEVVLRLSGGAEVAAIVTLASVEALALEAGVAATAVFKASSVILGTREEPQRK